jgi:SAM-dependent methyltransferase
MTLLLDKSSLFSQIINAVCAKSPFQKKRLLKDLENRDSHFFKEAEYFSKQYAGYLQSQGIPLTYAADAYLKLCTDIVRCQIQFMKTGKYPIELASDAHRDVYANTERMKVYMVGLAMSQFLWATHYEMFQCLKQALDRYSKGIRSYLEIGPGHGVFLSSAVAAVGDQAHYVAVDISPASIESTRSIMEYLYPEQKNIAYHTIDMLAMDLSDPYDFITMGEVIEHVNFPEKLLTKMRDLLKPTGHGFISTCVNCPAVDHVYHFRRIDEIKSMIRDCGLTIQEERILPVEDLPMEEIIEKKITINYCAIVTR